MRVASPDASRPAERGLVRDRTDLAMLALGVATLVLAALPVDRHTVPALERGDFRAVNDHTVLPFLLVWPVMHAAVVTLIASSAWPYLGRRARIVVVGLAAAVCLARVYVAAALPLDVVGGAALGLALAGLVRLILGRPG